MGFPVSISSMVFLLAFLIYRLGLTLRMPLPAGSSQADPWHSNIFFFHKKSSLQINEECASEKRAGLNSKVFAIYCII